MLGCLVEKQLTTPQQYPLTLNALTLACNQSSNRDPVVSYDEATVEGAVTSAKTKGLTRFVHPSHGRSAIRYAHMLSEVLGLDTPALGLLAVLMLRGPQTPGELRSRTERMARFDDLADIEKELELLARREEPLVERLARQPGQKEVRYLVLLGDQAPAAVDRTSAPADHLLPPWTEEPGERSQHSERQTHDAVSALELSREVADLRDEVQRLREDLEDLRSQLGA